MEWGGGEPPKLSCAGFPMKLSAKYIKKISEVEKLMNNIICAGKKCA